MRQLSLAYLAIIITTVTWSSSLIFAKLIFGEVGPIVFVALRYTLSCPFLLGLTLQYRRRKTAEDVRAAWKILMVAGLSGPFLSQVLQYIGLEITTASDAVILLNITPIFAVIIAAPVLNEVISSEKVGGLIVATIGVTLIVLNTSPNLIVFDIWRLVGDVIVILSTFFFAINGIAGKIAVKTIDAISLTFYSTVLAVPFIWISAALFDDVSILFRMSFTSWIVISWVAIVNTVIAYILYYESMKHIEASKVQITLNLIAVWGVLMSVLVLHEDVTYLQIFGGFLTVVGVIIAQGLRKDRTSPQQGTTLSKP